MIDYCLNIMRTNGIDLTKIIETFPDFPKKGILFRDINPVFRRYDALSFISQEFCNQLRGYNIDFIIGIESRGFVVATALALAMGKGLVLVRKAGKLPGQILKQSYDIEYGNSVMEIQKDSIGRDQKVLIADDLVATGGTAIAAERLVSELGGKVVGFAFVVELAKIGGATKIRKLGYNVCSLVVYD
jgi:adenine phosphoribosyltransferase